MKYEPVDLSEFRLLPHGVTTQRLITEVEFLRKVAESATGGWRLTYDKDRIITDDDGKCYYYSYEVPELAAYVAHGTETGHSEPKEEK